MEIVKETSPHIRRKDSLVRMMMDVIIALLPCIVFSFVLYPLEALKIYGISIPTMILSEFIYVLIKNKKPIDYINKTTFKEKFLFAVKKYRLSNFLVPLVSALIFSLIMPASASWYAIFVGALVGIILGKLVFGGTGSNIVNPAALGMVFSKLCFGSSYSYSKTPFFDVAASGTPLGSISTSISNINDYSLFDLFFGMVPGTIGETCKIAIICGGLFLLIRRAADWRIVVSYLLTFTVLMLGAALSVNSLNPSVGVFQFLGVNFFSGGMLFACFFMMTDPVTAPITSPGRFLYGALGASLTVIIRIFGALPEGAGFAVLLVNLVTPLIDYHKWSKEKFTLKNILPTLCIPAVCLVIVVLGVLYGGVIHA